MIHRKFLSFLSICVLVLSPLLFIGTPEASAKHPKGSQIAGEYIEGKTDNEVRTLLDDAITTWQDGDDLTIKSEYEIFELPRKAFTFDIKATIEEFNQKTKRKLTSFFIKPKNVHIPLHVKVNPSNDTVQELKEIDYIDTEKVFTNAARIAGELNQDDISIVYTDEEAIPFTTMADVSIDMSELTDDTFIESLRDLDGHTIQANDSFSLNQQIDFEAYSDDMETEANVIAGNIYHLFLQTNFQIAERHIHDKPPTESAPGLDAVIDLDESKDLVVVNPNDISFVLDVNETDDELVISLTSAYHAYTYDVELEEKELEPRTVYRYSADLEYGEQEVIQEGVSGTSVISERLVYNNDNELRHTEFISHDIYTLIPTIIEISTTDEETAQEETVEEQVDELEEIVSGFEEELAEVKEEASSNAEASERITSLADQLEDIQQQQAEFMQLIVSLQEQINQTDNSSDAVADEVDGLYDKLEERLTAIDERLETLEGHIDDLE